jgi:L-threonylcarbamoyladenylate synthase
VQKLPREKRIEGAERVSDAIAALRNAELVVYPTETFYALGADALSERALAHLFAAKAREADKPVATIAADAAMAFSLAKEISSAARRLAETFWPGPLTLVLPPRSGLPEAILGPDGGVGVRVSSHPMARELAKGLGHPITATSANLSGTPPATTPAEARETFGNKVKVYLEGGTLTAESPSTVVAVERGRIRILRAGAIPEREIMAAISRATVR